MNGQNQPQLDMGSESETPTRIALFMQHEENQRQLFTWLEENTEYIPVVLDSDDTTAQGELCIVDLPAVQQHRDWVATMKSREDPKFYPILLSHPVTDRSLSTSVWEVIDETISTPIQLPEFRHRLQNLLERRHLSENLAGQLSQSEERYRTVFEAVNDGILVLNPIEDTIIDCNPRAADLLGYSEAELQAVSPCEDLHAGDQSSFHEFIDNVMDSGRARTSELTCVRKDGSAIEVEVSASVLNERRGDQLVFSIRDVTERREQERVVERQRDQLAELNRVTRTLYETVQAVVQTSTREELEAKVCQRLAQSGEYQFAWIGTPDDRGEVTPRAYSRDAGSYLDKVRITVDETPTSQGPTGKALELGTVATVQDVTRNPSMEPWRDTLAEFDVKATASIPIRDEDDDFGVLNLYTSRKDAFDGEEQDILDHLGQTIGRAISGFQAREEVRLFRHAVEHAGHAIYITDTDGTITYVNPAFEAQTGYSAEEATGNNANILQSGVHDDLFYEELWDTIRSDTVWESKMINRRRDGRRLYTDQTIAPIYGDRGSIEHFVAVSTDITEQRRQQQQLQVLYRVLRHNLRNELNIIKGYTNLLTTNTAESESQNAVGEITKAVDDLLHLSEQARRIESTFLSGDPSQELRPLCRLIRDVVAEVNFPPVQNVTITNPQTEHQVNPELEVAVRELIKNAVKHNDAPEPELSLTVKIAVVDGSQWATIEISDNGPGIPENERRVLREGEESPLLHGQGLGLWLVNWVVTELGGDIEIRDNVPRGSVVTLRIPISN